MDRMLLNQKTVSDRKSIRRIQRQSKKIYGKGKSILKTKIGKLVKLVAGEKRNIQAGAIRQPDLEELQKLLEEAQLTGMSGNGFLVGVKIERILQKKSPRILIVNGVECEPGLIHDRWLMKYCREQISSGIQILQQALSFDRCILAYSMDREEQRSRRKKKRTEKFEVCHVPAVYPMGEEHFLIKQVLGIEIPKEEHPVNHGILILNVQTVLQIYNIVSGTYEKGRYLTAANLDTGEATVIYAAGGEKIRQRLQKMYPMNTDTNCFAGGGIMRAHEITDEDVFTDQICFVAVGSPTEISNTQPCKGCGKCNRKCPAGVDIREIVKRREKDIRADISGLGLENCVHCGCCAFFCRAGKDTAAYFGE